jgi:hypothetical protein
VTTVIREQKKLSEADIQQCERKIGRSVPEPYREFLLRHNGARVAPAGFRFTRDGRIEDSVVSFLLGVGVGDESIENYADAYRDRVPPDLFPIGDDPGGNLILIGSHGSNAGRIFYWHHELEAAEGEAPDYRNVFLIAESFEAFLGGLREPDADSIP